MTDVAETRSSQTVYALEVFSCYRPKESVKKELKIRELKSETPTEHAETEFHVDGVFAKTFLSLEATHTKEPILIREIEPSSPLHRFLLCSASAESVLCVVK